MFSAACLLISSAILVFILKYRVHVHVTYSVPTRRKATKGTPHQTTRPELDTRDLVSALRNLGAPPAIARTAAAKAAQGAKDFDEALKLAIQYATTKEAA